MIQLFNMVDQIAGGKMSAKQRAEIIDATMIRLRAPEYLGRCPTVPEVLARLETSAASLARHVESEIAAKAKADNEVDRLREEAKAAKAAKAKAAKESKSATKDAE